jgi:hypothetical protein
VKLSIGCGAQRRPDWITLDADPKVYPDYLADVPPLPDEIRAMQWEEVEMIHFIEHLFPWDAAELLRQVHECLIPGGRLVLEQPDIRFAAGVLAGLIPPLPGTVAGQCGMWAFYGDPTHKNPLFGHRWGYTPDTLSEVLVKAGFNPENISVLPALYHLPGRDFRIEGKR